MVINLYNHHSFPILALITGKKSFELLLYGNAIASESFKAGAGNAFSSDALLLAAVADRGEPGEKHALVRDPGALHQ